MTKYAKNKKKGESLTFALFSKMLNLLVVVTTSTVRMAVL